MTLRETESEDGGGEVLGEKGALQIFCATLI